MRARTVVFLLLILSHISLLIWLVYSTWTREISIFLGIMYIVGTLVLIRTYTKTYQKYSPENIGYSLDLPIHTITNSVTPEFIAEIIGNVDVIQVIKNDLIKTGQLGYKEVWRFGLITSDQDWFDPNPDQSPLHKRTKRFLSDSNYRFKWVEQIPLKRTAVLHNTNYFNLQFNNLVVIGGRIKPPVSGYPGWTYSLSTKLNRGEFIGLRNIQVKDSSMFGEQIDRFLPEFIKENGFPLKASYSDGDPLTTDRGGTIVIDRGNVIVIYPRYFVQRRLIDDEGNLVDLGIDENFGHSASFEVKLRPSLSRLLVQRVSSEGYIPILRYRSFPYASDFMLPLLDTPMSASGWADIFIDTRGKAKLFIAKEKTEAEWYEMMSNLQKLLYNELARKDFHLLKLTKDKTHLNEYLAQKQSILADYFIIQEFALL